MFTKLLRMRFRHGRIAQKIYSDAKRRDDAIRARSSKSHRQGQRTALAVADGFGADTMGEADLVAAVPDGPGNVGALDRGKRQAARTPTIWAAWYCKQEQPFREAIAAVHRVLWTVGKLSMSRQPGETLTIAVNSLNRILRTLFLAALAMWQSRGRHKLSCARMDRFIPRAPRDDGSGGIDCFSVVTSLSRRRPPGRAPWSAARSRTAPGPAGCSRCRRR